MKKIITIIAIVLTVVVCTVALTACGSVYDVNLPIGDGNVPDDAVNCHYQIAETIKDGYELKGYFTAESKADLSGQFIFSLSFDARYATSYNEKILFSFNGEDLKNAENGKLNFSIKFERLGDYFLKTDGIGKFIFHFHREDARNTDSTKWNASEYEYTYDGTKLTITK